ncbi:MAG: histidine kinase dimerization/phospho-acceptor domain-containing protein, partial [Bacteroidota bacterium]
MKLLAKINYYSLLFVLLLAPPMILLDYYMIKFWVNKEVNEILTHESERIQFELEKTAELPKSDYLMDIKAINENTKGVVGFQDTLIYEGYVDKLVPYRTYSFDTTIDQTRTRVVLRHILWEMNTLIYWLFVTTTVVIVILSFGLLTINRHIAKWAWKPFFKNLSRLEKYKITEKQEVSLESSDVSEFELLNKVILKLMNRIKQDFQKIKEFNENISHEMQTPLAIIRNKMVLLLENQKVGEKELAWIKTAYQETNKLSKIGKSLTLIARIENEEFKRLQDVDIQTLINNKIDNLEEMIDIKSLKIQMEWES